MGEGKRMVRFGIVGCGTIAAFHAAAIAQLENARLLGVWDALPEAARRFAGERGVRAYETMEAMLEDAEIDAVCICTPSGFHGAQAIDAVRHGKHVALEKPMCLELSQADELARLAGQNGCQVCVISQLRFSPAMRALKDAVEKKAFGRVVSGSLSMKYYRSDEYYASSSWRGTWRMDGGGALMNQGIHGVDLLQYLMGGVRAVTAIAKTQTRRIETEDSVVAVLEFANGALGTLEASTTCFPGYPRRLGICGDKGSAVLSEDTVERWDLSIPLQLETGTAVGGAASDPKAISCEGHRRQLENLVGAIEGREALMVDAAEGRKPLEIILAVYQSAREGRRVALIP